MQSPVLTLTGAKRCLVLTVRVALPARRATGLPQVRPNGQGVLPRPGSTLYITSSYKYSLRYFRR
eukprot:2642246-Rhodomonas_salina.3